MAIKRTSKVEAGFNMSSMTDIVFLLLIFFLVTSTLISPNALKLLLPKSNSQVKEKPFVTLSMKKNQGGVYLDGNATVLIPVQDLELILVDRLKEESDPTISLHAEKDVTLDEIVSVMNIAKNNKWKLILATSPESN